MVVLHRNERFMTVLLQTTLGEAGCKRWETLYLFTQQTKEPLIESPFSMNFLSCESALV
ncbi:hypothetical protein Ga0074115_106117 [endosymbiont of Ridgeia piscesae]|jgi:hypothetical protein|uniref:Uncharacterized protein n=1 Tax=endosymbiont of Ridgeia piscesae TaxID=54398 RepID=A0A0T5YSQ4_9GAMM|nr:hypothetical protein Ga0074115_106117 [endosymbiont of Ridgeia piscesae]KRT57480.1 hypothetical protein Ga0076813_11634 [endosymbiont of Ridgeia piscesae]